MIAILTICLCLSAVELGDPAQIEITPKEQYQQYVKEIADDYEIDPYLIEAMIENESSWRAKVESKCGAIGLMQILPKWHQDRMERLGVTNLKDPYSNILVGVDYIAELINRYDGNVTKALMYYNAGKKGAKLYNNGKISKYAKRILNRAEELAQEGHE